LALDLTGDAALPVVLRVEAAPPGLDEAEPGPTDLGLWPVDGRDLRGTLLAPSDRDLYTMTLGRSGVFDLSLAVDDDRAAQVRLQRAEGSGWADLLVADGETGQIDRPGLSLPAGHYQIAVSGLGERPSHYRLGLWSAGTDATGEPDDTPDQARLLEAGQTVTGQLGPDNPGFIRFAIPSAGHRWELRGALGLAGLTLTGPDEIGLGQWQARDGALVLRLTLPPGPFLAGLTGAGPYALRLTDLGPLPPDAETEPDDDATTAEPLAPGQSVTGDFQSDSDVDLFEIDLGAPTPLTLAIAPPDDGALDAVLTPADAPSRQATVGPDTATLSYVATFPAGRSFLALRPHDPVVSGRYRLSLARAPLAEPFEPDVAQAVPGDGRMRGRFGGLDREDQLFATLPQGAGAVVLRCTGALADWTLTTFGAAQPLAQAEPGQAVVVPFDPDLGGAVDWRVHGSDVAGNYDCLIAFGPQGQLQDVPSAPDGTAHLAPGQAASGRFETAEDRSDLVLDLPEGEMAALRCSAPLTAPDDAVAAAPAGPMLDGEAHVLTGSAAPIALQVGPAAGSALPQGWTCGLFTSGALRTPGALAVLLANDQRSEPRGPRQALCRCHRRPGHHDLDPRNVWQPLGNAGA
jgi:hypothetical protein